MMRRDFVWLCAALLAAAGATQAPAQGYNRQTTRQQLRNQLVLHTTGTVEQVRPGVLAVTAVDAKQWWIKLDPRATRIACQGEAAIDLLRPGMAVRFSGEFDEDGKAQKPVEELTVFEVNRDTRMGVYPDAGPMEDLAAEGEAGDVDRPQEKPPEKPAQSGGRGRERVEAKSGRFFVVGKLKEAKEGKYTVVIPGAEIDVELAPSAKIALETSDYSLASPGDTIEFRAKIVEPSEVGKPGELEASDVKIAFSKPVALPEAPRKRQPRGRGRGDDADKNVAETEGQRAPQN